MPRPTHAILATLLASTLLLSGCSGGSSDDPAEDTAGSTSATASGSATSSPSATPTEDATAEVLDPCAMVPEETWHKMLTKEQVRHAVLTRRFINHLGILISDDRTRYACEVGFDDSDKAPITWGYYPGPFFSANLRKLLKGAGGTPATVELGFLGYTTGDFISSDAYGIVGTTGLFVSVDEKVNSILPGHKRTKDKRLVAVLRQLGKHVDASVVPAKRDVPGLCPAPGASEVAAAYGKVDLARGGDDGDGHQWCLYRQVEAGSDLRLEAYHLTDDYFEDFYASTRKNPNGVDMYDGPPGMIRMVSIGEDGSGDTIILDPATHLYVDAKITYGQTKRRHLDRLAFLALARTFFDSVAETVDAD
ncbi:MAG: hypothetical protein JWO76_2144 [Nocardioides sp.]|nr:hypothetical protein [Nocardioides sp.]